MKLQRIAVDGLVTKVHQRHVTVFASSSTIGHRTTHNTVVHVVLGHHTRRNRHIRKGYVLHLVASGHGSTQHLVVPRLRTEKVTPSPAAVVVGFVDHVSPSGLVITPFSRDDGQHSGSGGSHTLTVDTSQAKVLVDGAAGKVRPGELVAVLGETDATTVIASRVYALSGEAEALSGTVTAINGDAVTIRSQGSNTTVSLGTSGNDLPLFVNGAPAAASQLRVHDRIVIVGVVLQEEEGFIPLVAFGFDGHDHGPCGSNPVPHHHHHH